LLFAGDELGRTQRGNNNAYCQDNEISWLAWPGDEALTEFVASVLRLRRERPIFRSPHFLAPDEVRWLRPDGSPMGVDDWGDPGARAVTLAGSRGLMLINAWWEPLSFQLPSGEIDTAQPGDRRTVSGELELLGRALVIAGASSRSGPID
jgi:pullulanase/glycogen debranching enzyme